ncbi:ATP-dependent helicase [bacterium]|nr:MAG: ATP-dependent helicase [bacterium]
MSILKCTDELTDRFEVLGLSKPILLALAKQGYTEPTPVQRAAIPAALAGDDIIATAKTGTGKTAAFALPILQRLEQGHSRHIRALVLTPTRELALQIDRNFRDYGCHLHQRTCVLLGGVKAEPQIRTLKRGVDILVATPGRLLDLMDQGYVDLGAVETFVLDEADRMLDMGFVNDVRQVVRQLPSQRQTLFFSATMSKEVRKLAAGMLTNPHEVAVAAPATVADNIEQRVMFVNKTDKRDLLADILDSEETGRTLIFTRTKRMANRVAKMLDQRGFSANAIHSNKSQSQRQKALAAFEKGRVPVLVATDIVSRGIDVVGITHVINYDLPEDAENYVHRIGRTARAGRAGVAVSLCGRDEVPLLRGIERLTRIPLTVTEGHPWHAPSIAASRHEDGPGTGRRPTTQRARRARGGGNRSQGARPVANRGGGTRAEGASAAGSGTGTPARRPRRTRSKWAR